MTSDSPLPPNIDPFAPPPSFPPPPPPPPPPSSSSPSSGGSEPGPHEALPAPAERPSFSLPWPPIIQAEAGFSLRPWGSSSTDADALAAAWNEPEIARWTKVPATSDLAAAANWIRGEQVRREAGQALDLVVAELGTPEHVLGEVGLILVEPNQLWAELGFWIAPTVRGQGLATTAVRAFSHWVLQDLPVRRLFAQIHPENRAALAVVARAGYSRAGALDRGTEVWVLDPSPAPAGSFHV